VRTLGSKGDGMSWTDSVSVTSVASFLVKVAVEGLFVKSAVVVANWRGRGRRGLDWYRSAMQEDFLNEFVLIVLRVFSIVARLKNSDPTVPMSLKGEKLDGGAVGWGGVIAPWKEALRKS
jgi:hypothetical protein